MKSSICKSAFSESYNLQKDYIKEQIKTKIKSYKISDPQKVMPRNHLLNYAAKLSMPMDTKIRTYMMEIHFH